MRGVFRAIVIGVLAIACAVAGAGFHRWWISRPKLPSAFGKEYDKAQSIYEANLQAAIVTSSRAKDIAPPVTVAIPPNGSVLVICGNGLGFVVNADGEARSVSRWLPNAHSVNMPSEVNFRFGLPESAMDIEQRIRELDALRQERMQFKATAPADGNAK